MILLRYTSMPFTYSYLTWRQWRQYGRVIRALVLGSGDYGFMTRFDHSSSLILVVPVSTYRVHLSQAPATRDSLIVVLPLLGPEKPLKVAVN